MIYLIYFLFYIIARSYSLC